MELTYVQRLAAELVCWLVPLMLITAL